MELYHADGGGWVLDDAQLTSTEGQFQLYTDFVDVRLEFWSWNDAAILPYKAQGCWLPTDPFVFYVRRLDFSLWAPGGVNEIPPVNTTVTNLDWAGAFNICHFMQLGASFVDYAFGDPGYVCVVWGRNCNDVRFSYYSPWTYVDLSFWGIQEDAYVLQIASRGSGEDWDEWDEHVLLHEYGHHFQNMFVDHSDSSSAVVHYYWAPTDEQGVVQEHLALNEGMANVFQAVVLSSGQLIDHDNQNDPILNYNFELPQPDAPYCVCTNGYQEIPSALDPIWPGASTEGAIVAAFWDMCDLDNDGNYFNLGDLWGHNNDHNASSSWLGYESLFDAYLNYDPSPADPDHDHAWDMDEIIIAWQQLGYPIDNAFLDNLAAHGIQLCNWLVGDADGSGIYSIDDAVFLIAYQFGDGPAPAPHPKGSDDCDCSGLVSISDAVYMINYIFAGGPPPSAVCDCQDFLSGIYSKVD